MIFNASSLFKLSDKDLYKEIKNKINNNIKNIDELKNCLEVIKLLKKIIYSLNKGYKKENIYENEFFNENLKIIDEYKNKINTLESSIDLIQSIIKLYDKRG